MAQANSRTLDPADMAAADNQLRSAIELGDILASLDAFTDSKTKVQLHRVDKGKPEYIRTLAPPIEMEELASELRDEYGGGDFMFKIMHNGKFRDNKAFSIAMPKSAKLAGSLPVSLPPAKDNMELFLRMSDESRKDQMNMMATMMTGMIGMMTAVVTGGGARAAAPDPAAMIASLASTMKSLQPEPAPIAAAGPNMSEMLETLLKMKELIGEGGGEETSFLGMAGKLLPPLIEAAKMGAQAGGSPPLAALPAPVAPPASAASLGAAPAPPVNRTPGFDFPDTPGHRILDRIRDDLAYLLKRKHDPELAAEVLLDVLDTQGVSPDELMAVVTEFQAAGEKWPDELARHGVKISTEDDVNWLNDVIAKIVSSFTADSEPPAHTGGKAGGGANPRPNGGARPAGNP